VNERATFRLSVLIPLRQTGRFFLLFVCSKLNFTGVRVQVNTMNLNEKQKENLAKSHQDAHRALAEAARKHRE